MRKLGTKLRALRHMRGWKQYDVARRLNISEPAYCNFESGKTDMHLSRIMQVAEVFGLTIAELLGDKPELITIPRITIASVEAKIEEYDKQLIDLQRKLIALMDELGY